MYTLKAVVAAESKRKQMTQQQMIDTFTNSDKLLKDLDRINPFVIGRVKPTMADTYSIFKAILKANGLNILGRVMKSGDQSYGNILATANAYVDKYLNKLQSSNRIKRLFNPLEPTAYKATQPKQFTLENLDYVDPKMRGKGQKLSDYLKQQDRTSAVVGQSLKDLLSETDSNSYIPNLVGFVLKYAPSSPARVKWMLDTMMRPYFTIGDKQPRDIENDLFELPLVSLLRKHGITGMHKRKNLSLYNIVVQSLENYLGEQGNGLTVDEATKNPGAVVKDLANPVNQLKFIKDLVNTNAQYKREAGKYEGRSSKSVSTMQESALAPEGNEDINVQELKDAIESKHNVSPHGDNEPTSPSPEEVALAQDPLYDAAFREVLATIMNNYVLASLPGVASKVINESNLKEDLQFKQMEFGIEQIVADKYAGDVSAALQSAFSPENIQAFYDPSALLSEEGRSTIANEMFSLIDSIIEDAAVKANLNPKLFTDEFKEGLSQKIAARLMSEVKPKIESSINQNFDRIVSSLVQRIAPKLTEQGGKFDKNTASLLLKEVLEYLDQFTAI